MKTLYSSTFLTAILAFLGLLGSTGTPITMVQNAPTPAFQTIIEPIGPALEPTEQTKVRLEIFNTFGCRACDVFGQGILPQLVASYAESDEVDLRLILIPDQEDAGELYATRGAHCAAKYDRFWDLIYKMHETDELSKREVDLLGQELNLPVLEFRSCLESDESDEAIGKDIAYAEVRQIPSTPLIYINDTVLIGAQPVENIDRIVKKYLNN